MRYTRWIVLLFALPALMLAIAACNGDNGDVDEAPTATESSQPLPTASDEGDDGDMEPVRLEVTAQNNSFVPDVIEAPAAVEFTIVFNNADDGIQHNLAIFATEDDATSGSDPIAATTIEAGPVTQELAVDPLPAGDYFVWCQVHTSQMTARLSVR